MVSAYLLGLIVVIIHIHIFFILGMLLKDNSIMSGGWGIGFTLVAIFGLYNSNDFSNRNVLVALLTGIWGLRLALQIIYRRTKTHQEEDFRYQEMRERWGERQTLGAYLNVYIPQGVLTFIIALPLMMIFNSDRASDLEFLDYIAIGLWVIGFFIETVSDIQMLRFKSNPENVGLILKTGLWGVSRHPNYFGDILVWWGIFLLAFPINLYSVISPILVTLLLRFVSGVPLIEKKFEGNLEYEEYKTSTNTLIPWF